MHVFSSFTRELSRLKTVATAERSPVDLDGDSNGDVPATVWQRMLTQLEQQAVTLGTGGGESTAGIHRDAQYVMAALADEVFLNLEWSGKDWWRANLLESRLFDSHDAGQTVFERIDTLLLERDPSRSDLAKIYLAAIALGFQGRYRKVSDDKPAIAGGDAAIAGYKDRLLGFVAYREPELVNPPEHLFPEAYSSTLRARAHHRLPYLRRWIVAIAAVLVLWAAVGHYLWRGLIKEMDPVVRSILETL